MIRFSQVVLRTTLLCCILMLTTTEILAQESDSGMPAKQVNTVKDGPDIHPLRIGLELGAPSGINLNAEYVTPWLDNRVAFYVDYLPFSVTIDDVKIKTNNFEIGTNIYFNNKGKGFYGSLGYLNYNGDAEITDVEFDNGNTGGGKTSINFSTTNVKIGGKFGNRFYFRIEAGFGFGSIPDELVITSTDGNGTTVEPIDDVVSFFGSSGIPLFSLGFGYAFL